MKKLVKLYDEHYMTKGKGGQYELKSGSIGVYSAGACYRLYQDNNVIACFVVKSDNYRCESNYSVNARLWTNMNDILDKANEIIESVESIYEE